MRWWRVVPVVLLAVVGLGALVMIPRGVEKPPAWLWACFAVGAALFLVEVFVDLSEIRGPRCQAHEPTCGKHSGVVTRVLLQDGHFYVCEAHRKWVKEIELTEAPRGPRS